MLIAVIRAFSPTGISLSTFHLLFSCIFHSCALSAGA